jgi:hypothetical protein
LDGSLERVGERHVAHHEATDLLEEM